MPKSIRFPLFSILILFIYSSCAIQNTNTQKWKLIWEDNFESNVLDSTKWNVIQRNRFDWGNYMSNHKDVIKIKKGKLYLRGINNPNQEKDPVKYLTGGVDTKGKFAYQYGKIEIRAKLENAQGAWPAMWMLASEKKYGGYPRNGEIDIMEHINHEKEIHQTVHSYYTLDLKETENPQHTGVTKTNPNKYNTYGLEWFPDKMVFTLNGKETFTYPKLKNVDATQWPFDQPFYFMLDMQLEGTWAGDANPKQLPVQMIIDWVKVYKNGAN